MSGNIRADIQIAIDQYVSLYAESKKLEKQIDALRKVIEPYMRENALDSINNTNGTGRVQLTLMERPIMTSRYTTYDIQEIASQLQPSARKKCIVEVVDKDKLEALCKLGEAPEELLSRKLKQPTYSMVVRFGK